MLDGIIDRPDIGIVLQHCVMQRGTGLDKRSLVRVQKPNLLLTGRLFTGSIHGLDPFLALYLIDQAIALLKDDTVLFRQALNKALFPIRMSGTI